jgi:hypothetical protein
MASNKAWPKATSSAQRRCGDSASVLFLHDGPTSDLLQAIRLHASKENGKYPPSEAKCRYPALQFAAVAKQRSVLEFLRSL